MYFCVAQAKFGKIDSMSFTKFDLNQFLRTWCLHVMSPTVFLAIFLSCFSLSLEILSIFKTFKYFKDRNLDLVNFYSSLLGHEYLRFWVMTWPLNHVFLVRPHKKSSTSNYYRYLIRSSHMFLALIFPLLGSIYRCLE